MVVALNSAELDFGDGIDPIIQVMFEGKTFETEKIVDTNTPVWNEGNKR
jgi:hypothetical protein